MTELLAARGDTVYASARSATQTPGLASLVERHGGRVIQIDLDVTRESDIEAAATQLSREGIELDLLVNCAGVLHGAGMEPEKKLEQVDPVALATYFSVHATGPILMAKHFLPSLSHGRPAVLASMSARVGSIQDNRLGGWYGYRASKAAQNMFTRTLAIELRRRAPAIVCVALHPGTVDTDLSRPFQKNVAESRLFSAAHAGAQLLSVIDSLTPDDTGTFLDWDRKPIPW